MEKSTFAHRVLLALGFGVITTIFLTSAYVGVLGTPLQVWLQAQIAPLASLYRSHRDAFNLAFVILGTGVPAVTGSLAILKAFYYAEMNLPVRLQELVEAAKAHHLAERPELFAYVRGPFRTQDFLVPAIMSNPLARLLQVFGISSVRHRAREYASSVDVRAREVAALSSKKEDIENRMITGRFLRAEYFRRLASGCSLESVEWRTNMESSLAEYQAIVAHRGADIDALEAIAAVEVQLGRNSLVGTLKRIQTAARRQQLALQQARALRGLAKIESAKPEEEAWDEARNYLVTAADLLDRDHAISPSEHRESGEVLLLLGTVQLKREKFSASRQALVRAKTIFKALNDDDGNRRVDAMTEVLDQAAKDKEGSKPD